MPKTASKTLCPTVADLIVFLVRNFDQNEPIAYTLWCGTDVREEADALGKSKPSKRDIDRVIFDLHHDINENGNGRELLESAIHTHLRTAAPTCIEAYIAYHDQPDDAILVRVALCDDLGDEHPADASIFYYAGNVTEAQFRKDYAKGTKTCEWYVLSDEEVDARIATDRLTID